MSFIDKYYAIFNNSVGQHSVTISRAEFANLLGVFSKQEQQLDQLKAENEELKEKINSLLCSDNCYRNKKLKQTLAEIKEIAKPFCEECKEYNELHKDRDCIYCNYNKILQKCEVLNEDTN